MCESLSRKLRESIQSLQHQIVPDYLPFGICTLSVEFPRPHQSPESILQSGTVLISSLIHHSLFGADIYITSQALPTQCQVTMPALVSGEDDTALQWHRWYLLAYVFKLTQREK